MHETASTGFSFNNDVPLPDDRREAPRYTTLLRVGLIESEGRKDLCLIKNISAGGLMAFAPSPLKVGERARVELKSGQEVRGTIIWAEHGNIGIRFDIPVQVEEILAAPQPGAGRRARLPRIGVESLAAVRQGALTCRARTIDISQGGAKLEVSGTLKEGAAVLSLVGLPPLHGIVRWQDGAIAGMSFNQMIPFGELVRWLKEREGDSIARRAA